MSSQRFNAGEPIGYFITWTTYGTWLPGDDRGWQRWHEGLQQPNEMFRSMAESEMKESLFTLSKPDREIVAATVIRHCEIREWSLFKVNPRSNHVHVVLSAPGYRPEIVRDQLKAWCTRKLKPNHPKRERFWTEGASCRWINHDDDLEAAIWYADQGQDRQGRE